MITKWKVSNFKSIQKETELDFGALTIFAGANSSGKSAFIQSILLVAQTLAHKVGSQSVVLNGALASLGQFDDLKSNEGTSDQITIKCTCGPPPDPDATVSGGSRSPGPIHYGAYLYLPREIACEVSFGADPSEPQSDLSQIQPRLRSTHLSCAFKDGDGADQEADISIRHSARDDSKLQGVYGQNAIDDDLRANLDYAVELDNVSLAEVNERNRSARPVGCALRHFLPGRITYEIDAVEENAAAITKGLQEGSRRVRTLKYGRGKELHLPEEIFDVLRDVLEGVVDLDPFLKGGRLQKEPFVSESGVPAFTEWHEFLRGLPRDRHQAVQRMLRDCDDLFDRIHKAMMASARGKSETHALIQRSPPDAITEATWYLDRFFTSSLKYLGSLRVAPKPLHSIAPTNDPHDVGLLGEHAASILELHKNQKISYMPSGCFNSKAISREMTTCPLDKAVIDWLQYLGVASSVESRDRGKLGHELRMGLSRSGKKHDLTHVGVGVSQVLPILVMCLLADEDSTLVFEQPELHLHPKVQTLLGDFFLSMALCNKQCIVETHSEYLMDRLRFRIAASSGIELNNLIKMYFVEKPSHSSSFREVVINEYGAITDWPEGFFDQSQQQAEEILIAAAAKRKANRTK